jgi:hypothetical protein
MPTITPSSFREFLLEKRNYARQQCTAQTVTSAMTLKDVTSIPSNTEISNNTMENCNLRSTLITSENTTTNKLSIDIEQNISQKDHSNFNVIQSMDKTSHSNTESEVVRDVDNSNFKDNLKLTHEDLYPEIQTTLTTGENIQDYTNSHTRQMEYDNKTSWNPLDDEHRENKIHGFISKSNDSTMMNSHTLIPLNNQFSEMKGKVLIHAQKLSNNHPLGINTKFHTETNFTSVHLPLSPLNQKLQSSVPITKSVLPIVNNNFCHKSTTILQDSATNNALIPIDKMICKEISSCLDTSLESDKEMERPPDLESNFKIGQPTIKSQTDITVKDIADDESTTFESDRIHNYLHENHRKKPRLDVTISGNHVKNYSIETERADLKSMDTGEFNGESQSEVNNIPLSQDSCQNFVLVEDGDLKGLSNPRNNSTQKNEDNRTNFQQIVHDHGNAKEIVDSTPYPTNPEQARSQISIFSNTIKMISAEVDDLVGKTKKETVFDDTQPKPLLKSSGIHFIDQLEGSSNSKTQLFTTISKEEVKKKVCISDPFPESNKRHIIKNESTNKCEMNDVSKKNVTNVITRFPKPSQAHAMKYLINDFGLEVENPMLHCTKYKFEGKEFESVDHLRNYLCRVGLVATQEWIEENMNYERFYCSSFGKQDLYIPKTIKAKCLTDWIRLAIIPEEYLRHPIDELSKAEAQIILAKFNIQLQLGYYTLDGDLVQWKDLEEKFATVGLSKELWEHPGATLQEKLSLLHFFMDYSTM